jgi:DHA1 family bicyclomycin/chloramphenicol resistance-like MFS transporter
MKTKGLGLTVYLSLLAAFPVISTDMALPAFSLMSESLKADIASVGLTLVVFMLGFALAPLLAGPFSDSFGRRRTLILGGVFFTAGALLCTLAPGIEWLLLARVIQGAGAGTCSVLSLTVVRDLFEGAEARTKLAQVNAVMGIAPILAPSLGSLTLAILSWRSIYGFTALAGFLVLLMTLFSFQESSKSEARRPLSFRRIAESYSVVMQNRSSRMHIIMNALLCGTLFAYISASPHVLMDVMGASKNMYGLLFAIGSIGIGIGAAVNGKAAGKGITARSVSAWGMGILLASNAALLVLTLSGDFQLWQLMPLITLTTFSFGMVAPNCSHGALAPLPEFAGAAAGLLGFTQMTLSAVASAAVAFLLESLGALAMSGIMFVCTLLAALVFASLRSAEVTAEGAGIGQAA